jgi:hypothetical protein
VIRRRIRRLPGPSAMAIVVAAFTGFRSRPENSIRLEKPNEGKTG